MTQPAADLNLLFGILALQMDFITSAQLIAGMQAWVNQKGTPLAEHLIRAKALQPEEKAALEPLIEAHLRRHANDPQKSLASLSSVADIVRTLGAINDPEITNSLQTLAADGARTELQSKSRNRAISDTATWDNPNQAGSRFRIIRPHAQGGLGEVYVARDTELGREVALKEIRSGKDDAESRTRFTREAEITGGLEHPGIVPVYGLGAYADGRPFYAMRFIRGKSLQEAIQAFHSRYGQRESPEIEREGAGPTQRVDSRSSTERNLELRRLLQRFIDVCEAIEYAHSRGVLHRDLKPGNIMLGRYGETLVVDWGLAKVKDSTGNDKEPVDSSLSLESVLHVQSGDSSATAFGSTIGTPAFMPPEQADGKLDLLCAASDVYSLGATLYCLLVGKPPVGGHNVFEILGNVRNGNIIPPRLVHDEVAKPLEAICLKAMSLRIADRYATANELAREIERFLADEPVEALRESFIERANRWSRRNRHWVQAGAFALSAVALAAVGAYFYERDTAARNYQLAQERGRLATEKGDLLNQTTELAQKETRAREEVEANLSKLRSALAQNYFAHGVGEYADGRAIEGLIELQRAWVLSRDKPSPIASAYQRVLWDRAMRGGRSPYLPMRHDIRITAAIFSPDGSRVATCSGDRTAKLWDAKTCASLNITFEHPNIVTSVGFTPSGDRVLTGCTDGGLRIWDSHSSAAIGDALFHSGPISQVRCSPDGKSILANCDDRSVHMWDIESRQPLWAPIQLEQRAQVCILSPEGDRIFTATPKGAQLWDAKTGEPIGQPIKPEFQIEKAVFSPDGNSILSSSVYESVARLWDAHSGAAIGKPLEGASQLRAACFDLQGKRAVIGDTSGSVRLWNIDDGTLLANLRSDNPVKFVIAPPPGNELFVEYYQTTGKYWSFEKGAETGESIQHDALIASADFNPSGDRLLTCGYQTTAMLWNSHDSEVLAKALNHNSLIVSAEFSGQGDKMLTITRDAKVRAWDIAHGVDSSETSNSDEDTIAAVFVSPGNTLLTASLDAAKRQVSIKSTNGTVSALQHDADVTSAAFSSDGHRLLTKSTDNKVRLWDVEAGTILEEPWEHDTRFVEMVFSPKGDRFVISSVNGFFWVRDSMTGALIVEQTSERRYGSQVKFNRQGDKIVVLKDEKTVEVWSTETGSLVGTPITHEFPVYDATFNPQGDRIVTSCVDRAARQWEVSTGRLVGEPLRNESAVFCASYDSTGNRIITGCQDGTVTIWDAQTSVSLHKRMKHDSNVIHVAFSPQGDRVLTCDAGGVAKVIELLDVPLPSNLLATIEWITGHVVTDSADVRPLEPNERLEREKIISSDHGWLNQMAALSDAHTLRHHVAALRGLLNRVPLNSSIADFHLGCLDKLAPKLAADWRTRIEVQNKANNQGPKRIHWKSPDSEFVQQTGSIWIERIADGATAKFEERERTSEYVELFDADRSIAVRLYSDKMLLRFPGAFDFKPFRDNGKWVE